MNLPAGATIQAPNAGAAAIRVSSAIAGANPFSNFPNLNLDGTVTGGASGISVDSGVAVPPNFTPPSINPRINIGAAGSVTGVSGINLVGNLANPQFAATQASVVNRGTISGTGGFALLATNPDRAYFHTVENLASGRIGAIYAYVGQLTNAGTIDGGTNSAYSFAANLPYGGAGTITNSGTITSASAVATIATAASNSNFSPIGITNTGRIVNTGAGKAIVVGGAVSLTNRGTIIGTVDASAASPYFLPPFSNGNRIDNGGGTIDGSVLLGPGNDTLIVDFETSANPVTGITGAIDGGTGNDTLQLNLGGSVTLSAPVSGVANFETLAFAMPVSATLTLARGFTAPTGLRFADANGTLVNDTDLVTNGPAFAPALSSTNAPAIVNNGSITSTNNTVYAAVDARALTNSGTITAISPVGVDIDFNGSLINTGTITGTTVAVKMFDALLDNRGLIQSSNGIGLDYLGSSGRRGVNGGTIQGAQAGVRLAGTLENRGTIQSPTTGVRLSWNSSLTNAAGATITGGIAPDQAGIIRSSLVDNAGTINGNVDFGFASSASNNRFIARAGGVVNGNLNLGSGGDTLIAEFSGSGPLGGVTGIITGTGFETLQYLMATHTTTQVGAPAVFDAVVYDLKDVTLNLSTPGTIARSLGFLGKGTVNFSGSLIGSSTADDPISVNIGDRISFHTGADGLPPQGITFVNSGTIARNRLTALTTQAAAIWGGDIVNAGIVSVVNTAAEPFSGIGLTGIVSGGSVINSGTITVAGAVGVAGLGGRLNLVNSGSILQIAGQPNGRGVVGAEKVTNTGTISTGGDAVTIGAFFTNFPGSVTNSGLISSAAGYGVRGENTGWTSTLTNEVGGTISGAVAGVGLGLGGVVANAGTIFSAGTGVLLGQNARLENRVGGAISGAILAIGRDPALAATTPTNATVRNAGTITGNVNLAGSSTAPTRNTFVALAGGRLDGNLNLGTGDDTLVVEYGASGPLGGVTGTISGTGDQALRYLINADTAVSLGTTSIFNTVGFDLANNVVVTAAATGPKAMNVEFAGVGTVDLTADITGNAARPTLNLAAASVQQVGNPLATPQTKLVVTSRGALSATADANTPLFTPFPQSVAPVVATIAGNTFTNAGTITARNLAFANRSMAAIGGGGTIINNGTINLDGATGIDAGNVTGGNLVVTNTGTIQQRGAVSRGVAGVLTLTNSGSIRTGGTAVTPAGSGIATGIRQITNSGTIESTGGLAIEALDVITPTFVTNAAGGVIAGNGTAIRIANGRLDNSGTINGNVDLGGNFSSASASNRGTINGAVRFGGGSDTLTVYEGGVITGLIDGGAGIDTYTRVLATSADIDLGVGFGGVVNFERLGFGAANEDTTLIVRSASGPYNGGLVFTGAGTIVNEADTTASTIQPQFGQRPNAVLFVTATGQPSTQVAFVNRGTLGDGAFGAVRSFENRGTIGTAQVDGTILRLNVDGTSFSFLNAVAIRTTLVSDAQNGIGFSPAVTIGHSQVFPIVDRANIANEGEIDGGVQAQLRAREIAFSNSGTITGRKVDFGSETITTAAVGLSTLNLAPPGSGFTEKLTFANSGNLIGGTGIYGEIDDVSLVNTGTMGSVDMSIGRHAAADPNAGLFGRIDNSRVAFDNAGSIDGGVSIEGSSRRLDFVNSGAIVVEGATDSNDSGRGVGITIDTLEDAAIAFTNSGSITSSAPASGGVLIAVQAISPETQQAPFDPFAPAVAGKPTATLAFTNSGTISADGGAEFAPAFSIPAFPTAIAVPPTLSVLTGAGVAMIGEGETSVTLTNTATGVISANGQTTLAAGAAGEVPAELGSVGSLALGVIADRVTIVNEGRIVGNAGGTVTAGVAVDLLGNSGVMPDGAYLAGAIQTIGSIDTLTNRATGTITGSIDLGDFDDFVVNYGRIDGDLFLRAGNDSLTHALSGSITGLADGGDGIDQLTIDLAGGGTLDLARFVNFEDFSFTGSGSLGTDAPLTLDTVSLAGGDLQIAAGQTLATAGPNTVTGTDANESITNAGTIAGNVTLLGGGDSVGNSGTIAGSVLLGAGNDRLANTGAIGGGVDFGDGNDTLTGIGAIAGPVQMGAGDDTASLPALAGAAQGIDGGTGTDLLLIDAATTATLTAALAGRLSHFEAMQATGTGMVDAAGVFAVGSFQIDGATVNVAAGSTFGTAGPNAVTGGANADRVTNAGTLAGNVALGDGANQIANTGAIAGGVTTGSGDDSFTNGGVVNGNVNLGNGNNSLTVLTGGMFNGAVAAGAGADQLIFQTNATYQAPTQINAAAFTGFETLQNAAGASRLTGSFAGAVNVTGGYLFGALGSTIVGNVNVGAGAQFGTSGVVNGNVAVGAGGTLAPGSSPGVMTVNGNVALAAGSSSIFEFVPAPGQSDQLLISGSLTIGANTTLTMTGTRPLTPGVNYDLIVANGGITGTFATVNQPATIGGFLRYTPNRLQLMGTFLTPTGVTVQQASAIGYVNTVLISGQVSAPLLAAVPSLLRADGAANPAVFNLLTAEAYASASQLAVENALGLAQAGRSGIVRTTRDEAGTFVFAQGMGDRRTLKAHAAIGTSKARSESWGVLGGIGYGVDGASIGAFIGRIDSRQRIAALGGATDADGIVAGLAGHFAIEGFEFGLLGAYDWTRADTGRSVPSGGVDSSRYRLGSLLIDASVGANIPLGTDWAMRPEAGITHVRGHRGAAREIGSTAFALDTDRDRFGATFVDTSIALKGGMDEGAVFHPWLQVGIRRQIAGGTGTASAGFVGTAARFTSFGAGGKEQVVTAGAGLSYDIGGVTLFAAYQGEFGGGNGHNGNVGVRFGF